MPETDSAVLRVVVTAARGAYPLEGASVTVTTAEDGAGTLLYSVTTDRDGTTPPLTLPTPPRADSLTPDAGPPFSLYTVEIAREGFVPMTALHIAMFPDVPAVLPVALTPLGENQTTAPPEMTATGDTQALYHTVPAGEE